MRGKHIATIAVVVGTLTSATAGAADASRRCGPASTASGAGSLGTPWTLKSMHDDDGPGGTFVVGEEFEIDTHVAGQAWTITFADNGKVFFTATDVATADGIREVRPTANQPGTNQHMTAHAVDVAPVPNCGG